MDVEIFKKNVIWNIAQIAVQARHAEQVNSRAKSGYYKAAIMIASSVVEALAYKLLEENKGRAMPLEDWRCVQSHPLPKDYKSSAGELLSVCERVKPQFKLTKHTDFKKVNEVCKKLKLFSDVFFKKIEKVRKLRNKIHIQGLDTIDRSYTKKELEFLSSIMNRLLSQLTILN